MTWFRLTILVLLCVLFPSVAPAAQPALPTRPNILLLIADNWAYPHAGCNGDRVVQTPAFDHLAREGARFTRAFCMVPSCAPSRAVLLTGQAMHRLEGGANNWGPLPAKFPVYPEILAQHGYTIGFAGKGWDPASLKESERSVNPAGPQFESLAAFLDAAPREQPFCFWFGSRYPHRQWTAGAEAAAKLDASQVQVPAYLPDTPAVRQDILAYYGEVQAFDRQVAEATELLKTRGLADNTLLIVCSDNGWQMPHGLGNLYDAGTHVPFVVRWPGQIKPGTKIEDFLNFDDLAPTLLEAAGVIVPAEMTGRSLVPLLQGKPTEPREQAFLERERHAFVRPENLGYPMRGVRTRDFLYVRNFAPDRWPAGDPTLVWSVGPFGDIDRSVTKQWILEHQAEPAGQKFYTCSFARRPREELYDLRQDPAQVYNLAYNKDQVLTLERLGEQLKSWMKSTDDPRFKNPSADAWDRVPYFGPRAKAQE